MGMNWLSLSTLGWNGLSADIRAWALALSMSLVMAIGGVAFKFAFQSLGSLSFTPAAILSWIFNPWVIIGLGCGVGARLLYYAALAYMSLGEITLLSAMSMVMTVILAYFIFGEVLTIRELIGAALVLIGVILIEG